jgi:hypothetical protein
MPETLEEGRLDEVMALFSKNPPLVNFETMPNFEIIHENE